MLQTVVHLQSACGGKKAPQCPYCLLPARALKLFARLSYTFFLGGAHAVACPVSPQLLHSPGAWGRGAQGRGTSQCAGAGAALCPGPAWLCHCPATPAASALPLNEDNMHQSSQDNHFPGGKHPLRTAALSSSLSPFAPPDAVLCQQHFWKEFVVEHPQALLEVVGKQGVGSGRTVSALTQISDPLQEGPVEIILQLCSPCNFYGIPCIISCCWLCYGEEIPHPITSVVPRLYLSQGVAAPACGGLAVLFGNLHSQ